MISDFLDLRVADEFMQLDVADLPVGRDHTVRPYSLHPCYRPRWLAYTPGSAWNSAMMRQLFGMVGRVNFDTGTLALWERTAEIAIETSRDSGAPVHRTVIWIVVDGDAAYVRSVRGPAGRWYRELQANPHGAVHADGRRVAVDAEPAADAATVARVSDLLRQKYEKRWPGPTAGMLREEVVPTTIRLRPAASASS